MALEDIVIINIQLTPSGGIIIPPPPLPSPTVTSVTPPMQFNMLAGEPLIVRGSNFVTGAIVLIDGVQCTSVVVHNSVKIFCNAPALSSEGKKDVQVVNPSGQNATLLGSSGVTAGYRGFTSTSVFLWLDPASALNDTTTVAGKYKTMYDRSGNARHYTNTDNTKLPTVANIGGIPCGHYSGNLHLRGPGFPTPAAAECFVQIKKDTDAGGLQSLHRTGSGTNGTGFYPTGDRRILDEFASTTRKDTNGSPAGLNYAVPHVYNVTSKANSWTVRINNVQHYTTATNTVGFHASSGVLGGGADASAANAIDYAFTGNIGEYVIFGRECTQEERDSVQAWWTTKYGQTYPHTLVLCDGDSITAGTLIAGTGLTYPQSLQAILGGGYVVVNQGLDGDTIANMQTVGAAQVDPFLTTYAALPNKYLVGWAGTNDNAYGQLNGAQIYAKWITYATDRFAAGWGKVFAVDMLPRSAILSGTDQTTFNNNRATFNGLIQVSHAFVTDLVDIASDPTMGPNGAELNTTNYVDRVHPTNLGAAYNAQLIANKILAQIPDV